MRPGNHQEVLLYTAREDAGRFKTGALAHLRTYYGQQGSSRSLRVINLRQQFPTEWSRFLQPPDGAPNVLSIAMRPELFPGHARTPPLVINTVWLLGRCTDAGGYRVSIAPPLPAPPASPAANPHELVMVPSTVYGGLHFVQKDVSAFDLQVSRSVAPTMWTITMTRPDGGRLRTNPAGNTAEIEDLFLIMGYELKL